MNTQIETVKLCIDMCLQVIRTYDWLLDLYVLDFFVDNHWNRLPLSWRECLEHVSPEELGMLLQGRATRHVLPLALLALLRAAAVLSVPRRPPAPSHAPAHPLNNLYMKHVKLKKRHEISMMASIVTDMARKCNCDTVVDFGSGLGHLVRLLAYRHGLRALGIDAQEALTLQARKLDSELEYSARKHVSASELGAGPRHETAALRGRAGPARALMEAGAGLVGLHPCGDLGPLLLHHFVRERNARFLCLVSCCYMKLSETGYPLSHHLQRRTAQLSYAAREIACHAIETYCDRLLQGDYHHLKVHAYRAALECVLAARDPPLRHAPVRSVRHTHDMTFHRYCVAAAARLGERETEEGAVAAAGARAEREWARVVVVYSLRLALAPLVESLLLLDRVLFVLEAGLRCEVRPVFDPRLSPRNHVIVAWR